MIFDTHPGGITSSLISKHLIHRILEGSIPFVFFRILLDDVILVHGGDGFVIGFIGGDDERNAVNVSALLRNIFTAVD